MFTFEIRINGDLISHIYGHNERLDKNGRHYEYSYRHYSVETGDITAGTVKHERKKGINKLIRLILEEVEKTTKKA